MKGKESRFIDRKSSFIYSKVGVLFIAISDEDPVISLLPGIP
jgi:hypothetical protein